ncbi:uncharacterized protein LOC143903933 [Temnothorax americanus]|uniref:uncharacterized protein LOC143903933 n=1 Tax=Temnothorax americanus TaxID=1964332 RepID=UPI004067C23D
MAIFKVGFYLSVLAACIVISPSLIQGRSLRRRHGHHSHSSHYNLEESLPRDLSGRLEDDLESYRNSYGQTKTRGHPQILNRFSKYEGSEDRVPPYFRRSRHESDSRGRESLRPMELVARRKRHNKHDSMAYQKLSKPNEQNGNHQGSNDHEPKVSTRPIENDPPFLELEVKEAQNRSICKYTVESVPDVRGSRVPKDLEHVKCNYMQSHCQGIYCCIQTYKNIEVSYGDGEKEKMRLYVGCVCAEISISNDVRESHLPIDD